LGVEHLAVRNLGELLHLELQIIHEGLDLWAPGTEIRGGDLESRDAVGAVGEEFTTVDSFQIGDPLADVEGEVGARGLKGVEALVDGGGAVRAGTVEIGKPALPLLVVGVESAIEILFGLLNLIEDDLELGIHGAQGTTESGEVGVVDLVRFQRVRGADRTGRWGRIEGGEI